MGFHLTSTGVIFHWKIQFNDRVLSSQKKHNFTRENTGKMQNKNNYINFCFVALNPSLNLSPER